MKSRASIMREVKIGAAALILAIGYLYLSFTIPVDDNVLVGARNTITPDFLPKIIAVVGIASALFILIPNLIQLKLLKDKKSDQDSIKSDKEIKPALLDKDMVIFLLLFAVYLIVMRYIGYVISTIIYSFGMLTYLEKNKMRRNLLFAILVPVLIYFLFNYILQIWLPTGIIFG